MLNKLIKYDLKSFFKTVTPLYIVMILIALLARLGGYVADKISILKIPVGFIEILYILLLIGIPIATFILSISRYYNNLVKDEGYLMHTLPVSKENLILSKLISSLIVMSTSIISIVIGFMIGTYTSKIGDFISKTLDLCVDNFGILFIVLIIISTILSYIMQLLLIYAAIALGQKHNNNKIVFSIIYGIVLYNINQIITSVILLIPMFLNDNIRKYLESDMPPINILNGFIIASLVLSAIIIVVYYFFTTKTMDKKLNLE